MDYSPRTTTNSYILRTKDLFDNFMVTWKVQEENLWQVGHFRNWNSYFLNLAWRIYIHTVFKSQLYLVWQDLRKIRNFSHVWSFPIMTSDTRQRAGQYFTNAYQGRIIPQHTILGYSTVPHIPWRIIFSHEYHTHQGRLLLQYTRNTIADWCPNIKHTPEQVDTQT